MKKVFYFLSPGIMLLLLCGTLSAQKGMEASPVGGKARPVSETQVYKYGNPEKFTSDANTTVVTMWFSGFDLAKLKQLESLGKKEGYTAVEVDLSRGAVKVVAPKGAISETSYKNWVQGNLLKNALPPKEASSK